MSEVVVNVLRIRFISKLNQPWSKTFGIKFNVKVVISISIDASEWGICGVNPCDSL